jgi:hypothetical protein
VVLDISRIAQSVGNVAWRDESIACLENEGLLPDDYLQFSGENLIRLVLTRMRMTRHAHPRRETDFPEAVCAAGICAR